MSLPSGLCVPTPTGSTTILVATVEKSVTKDEINAAMKAAFVVQDAAEIIVSSGFNVSWFTLKTIVGKSFPAGAEITTLR